MSRDATALFFFFSVLAMDVSTWPLTIFHQENLHLLAIDGLELDIAVNLVSVYATTRGV